ncbi:MAG: PAS domain-containing protein [Jatrophihabitans sp.]|uniref:PAS domain-containing protein n=1 Tax=Jatrophihabitans sp. TaxID=1932789 RepID=UPI003F80C401
MTIGPAQQDEGLRSASSRRAGAQPVADIVVDAVIGAVAQDAPAVAAVDLSGDAPHLLWLNPAARELVGRGGPRRARDRALLPAPAARPWLEVVSDATDGADEWHTAWVDGPTPLGTVVRLRVRPLPGGAVHLVWLRPADDAIVAAEERAAEAEARFRALAAHTGDGVLVSEQGARLAFSNDRFAALCGRAADDLRGTAWLSAVHPEDLGTLLRAIDAVLAGARAEVDVRFVTSPSPRPARVRLAPLLGGHRPAGFVATVAEAVGDDVELPAPADLAATEPAGQLVAAAAGATERGRLLDRLALRRPASAASGRRRVAS